MKELQPNDVFQLLSPGWDRAIAEKRFHDAIESAAIGYLVLNERQDEVSSRASLIYLRQAVDDRLKQLGGDAAAPQPTQSECSFCRKEQPPAKLIAGADAYICGSCATLADDVLNKGK